MTIIIHGRKTRVKINIAKFLLSMVVIFSGVFGTLSLTDKISNSAMSAYEHSEEFVVTYGDTLWSIASMCNDGSYDNRKIINDIIKLNNLNNSDVSAGQVLIIPGKYNIIY
ncbi:MAG: LysM peptidoglycan-binding domain-containing protein [Clostridia bacterium]|nr:LysM peptidoglycan-binding domain-containing protein [Clostridia bacterium]